MKGLHGSGNKRLIVAHDQPYQSQQKAGLNRGSYVDPIGRHRKERFLKEHRKKSLRNGGAEKELGLLTQEEWEVGLRGCWAWKSLP